MRVPCTRVEARGQPLAFPQVPSTRAAFETGPLTGLHSGLCSLASELPHRLPLPSQHPQLYFFFFKPRLKLKFSRLQRSMVTAVSLDLPLLGSLHPPQTPVHRCVPPPPACSASWLPFLPLPGVRGAARTQYPTRVGLTSQRKGFSPECCSECTLRDMLRLKDFPQVSQVKGMSLVWAVGGWAPSVTSPGTYPDPHLLTCHLRALYPTLDSMAHPSEGLSLGLSDPQSPGRRQLHHHPSGYPACSRPAQRSLSVGPIPFTLCSGAREARLPGEPTQVRKGDHRIQTLSKVHLAGVQTEWGLAHLGRPFYCVQCDPWGRLPSREA